MPCLWRARKNTARNQARRGTRVPWNGVPAGTRPDSGSSRTARDRAPAADGPCAPHSVHSESPRASAYAAEAPSSAARSGTRGRTCPGWPGPSSGVLLDKSQGGSCLYAVTALVTGRPSGIGREGPTGIWVSRSAELRETMVCHEARSARVRVGRRTRPAFATHPRDRVPTHRCSHGRTPRGDDPCLSSTSSSLSS